VILIAYMDAHSDRFIDNITTITTSARDNITTITTSARRERAVGKTWWIRIVSGGRTRAWRTPDIQRRQQKPQLRRSK